MSFSIDFDRPDFPNIEPGVYDAVIHSAVPTKGPKGTYLKVRFALVDDEMNSQAWLNLSLADKALWRVSQIVRDLGIATGETKYKSRKEFETALVDMLTGVACRITVENEVYKKTLQDRVTKVEHA